MLSICPLEIPVDSSALSFTVHGHAALASMVSGRTETRPTSYTRHNHSGLQAGFGTCVPVPGVAFRNILNISETYMLKSAGTSFAKGRGAGKKNQR
jgi:hypothetical protein